MALDLSYASSVLTSEIADLDIPDHVANAAVQEYQRVAAWLGAVDSPLSKFDPHLYPQGSFRLGTPVRPIRGAGDFDIDLVCRLDIAKESTTQKDLKRLVGDRLKAHGDLGKRLEELRRCWTLLYQPDFHLDVLPCVPDPEMPGNGILLTDKDLTRWQFSNPIGYSDWFFDRMRHLITEARQLYAQSHHVNVEDVPDWSLRTPLQRAVQLLKRHRDIKFENDPDRRPVSIIITTLAGHAYRHQTDIAATVVDLAERMPDFIENRNGRWWVANPAHANENFADKWNEYPDRRDAFLTWLVVLRNEIMEAANAPSERDARLLLERAVRPNVADPIRTTVPAGVPDVPALDDTGHAAPPPWPVSIRYECSVAGDAHPGVRQGARIHDIARILFKRAGLRFKATTNTPPPYQIKWQVTNTGAEARRAGALRGRAFEDGEGAYGEIKWESTSYAGTHLVEAFVVQNGMLVARSGQVRVRIAR